MQLKKGRCDVGDSPQLLEQTSHPLVGCFVKLQVPRVMGLNHFPIGDWEGKQEVAPSNHIMGWDSSNELRG